MAKIDPNMNPVRSNKDSFFIISQANSNIFYSLSHNLTPTSNAPNLKNFKGN